MDALGNTVLTEAVDAMFIVKPKATKEEKKAAAAAKAKARKAAKGGGAEEEAGAYTRPLFCST